MRYLTISPTYTTIPETPGARIRLERIELVPGFCGQFRQGKTGTVVVSSFCLRKFEILDLEP